MRYFKMKLATSEQQIREKAKINLRDYGYDSTIAAVNVYMHKTMRNGLSFLIYRLEDNGSALAGFSFDEKNERFDNAYSYIMGHLKDAFSIRKVKEEPYEVTMFEYSECLNEA